MLQQVLSYQIAEGIDIKAFKSAFKSDLYYGDADELFYRAGSQQFIYVFKYGVVCFLNYDAIKVSEFLQLISSYCRNAFDQNLTEEFKIQTNAGKNKIGFNSIEIAGSDIEVLRLIMLTVSQSVALDYYEEQTTKLIEETNHHTQMLEAKGRLNISGINLKKYIGKTLALKNRIAENLYIFDSPPETWDDENLNKIHNDLKRTFDLKERFRDIQEGLNIVKDNLELFRDLLQYRNSYRLELVIIILILVEVINIFAQRIFN
ncbi:MAG: RMD1 family protein [Bacteroidota bacterium]|nr:RMD1 family protein [Bacteroidota bacterium]